MISSLKNDLPSETFNNAFMVFGQMQANDCMELLHQLTDTEHMHQPQQHHHQQHQVKATPFMPPQLP